MITTRKIKLTVLGDTEERKRAYSFLKDEMYNQFKALNECMSHMYFNFTAKNKIQQVLDIEDEKEARKEALCVFKKAIVKSEQTNLRNIMQKYNLMGETKDRVTSKIASDFSNDIKDILCGNRSIRNYKRSNPLLVRVRNWKIEEDGDSYILKGFMNKIKYKIILGTHKNRQEVESILRKIILKEYKMCDSSLYFDKNNHLMLNLCLNIPDKVITEKDENKTVGVDLGLAIPAYCTTNENEYEKMAIGSMDDFLRVRLALQKQKRNLQKSLKSIPHSSRSKKLSALERIEGKERNFAKTYNHFISKSIIDFTKKVKASQINLELLEGFMENERNDKVLRNWSYYELQSMIEYKAKREGINVAYIDPYHTSQTCSCCGHYEQGQRVSQSEFICKGCGVILNADFNGSKNIAKSTKYVIKKEDCEYYKMKKTVNV